MTDWAAMVSPRYDRQVRVEGFRQSRLMHTVVQLHPRQHTQRVMTLAAWLFAAIGSERIIQVGAPQQMAELLRFNPRLQLTAVPPEVAWGYLCLAANDKIALLAREGDEDALQLAALDDQLAIERDASLPRTLAELYVTPADEALMVGSRVAHLGGALPDARHAPRDSAAELLAAAVLVGLALRRIGAWGSGGRFRRFDDALVHVSQAGPPQHAACLGTLLIVGGGGALGHAFLAALLADRHLRAGVERIVLIDPDALEVSNLNRQWMCGDLSNLGRGKAEVTAEELRARWPAGERVPEIVPIAERASAAHVARYQPGLTALFPDNVAARAHAWQALEALPGSRLVLLGGTEFTFGQVRLLQTRSKASACANCGPEQLAHKAALAARNASCAAEATPSNVLSNALVGALAALEVRKWMATGQIPPHQMQVNWQWQSYFRRGPAFEPCACPAP